MISQVDILRQMNIYLPFVTADFESSTNVIDCAVDNSSGQTLIVANLDDASNVSVGLHYHLKGAYLTNPITAIQEISAGFYQIDFENYHNLTMPQLEKDNKVVRLRGTEALDYEFSQVIDEYSIIVKSPTPIISDVQLWELNSETCWMLCIEKTGNTAIFKAGIGYAYNGTVEAEKLVTGQHVYIAPTRESVMPLYSQTAQNKKACYIVFGDRATLSSNKNDAGETSRNAGKYTEDLRVSTDIDLFVIYPADSSDEKHIKATIDACTTTYDNINKCLYGHTRFKNDRQITPTNSGYVAITDSANYVHQYSYQAIDFINIVGDGLYYNKAQDDEVLRRINLDLRFKTEFDGDLSDVLMASVKLDGGNDGD